jgi:hypothetical protein
MATKIANLMKKFFENPITMAFEAVLIIVMVFFLLKAGITASSIEQITMLLVAITGLIDGGATFFTALMEKQKKLLEGKDNGQEK